ncbi:MAG: alpha/beta hydrolase, partial [Bullifex sp.]|nr:alpha/beta hydrolase [Spirochaetales bacterium]MDY5777541.1 alpha/beta hydrolase [Bullifex sp.]
MKKGKKIIAAVVLALLAVLGIGGFAYVSDYYHADDDALKALELQGDGVQVEQDGSVIWFIPEEPVAGIIFYPGGKVEYTAYAPLLRSLAGEGILSALVKMPCNLA